jgi:sugar phosphate permease
MRYVCPTTKYIHPYSNSSQNVMGLQADTATTPDQFSYLALAFYCSYLVCEIPQGYLMQRFPTAKYIGIQIILWGVCVTLNCACKSFAALMAVRVLLGCFESAVAPALMLITGMWASHPSTIQPSEHIC